MKKTPDVQWYIPNKKKPIAYSTIATSELISMLSVNGKTIKNVKDEINFDEEAKDILQIYIDKGFGNNIAEEMFRKI